MSVVVACPGSFDPVTLGHLDVFARAAACFDRVVVAVLANPGKQGLFTVEERMALVADEVADLPGVEVASFSGLLVDFCTEQGIGIVCKGLRSPGDLDYELQMAQMNRRIGGIETILLPASPEHRHLSSSLVKEVARLGGPVDEALPPRVAAALLARLREG